MVNVDQRIRPYLHHYPATINELDFSLSFPRDCSQERCPPDIVHVFHANGEVCYFTNKYIEVHHETYEKAFGMVLDEYLKSPIPIDDYLSKLKPLPMNDKACENGFCNMIDAYKKIGEKASK